MNHRRWVVPLLVALATAVVACDEASPPDAAPPGDATVSPTPSTTLVAPGRCPNEPDAPAGEVVGGRASGDVDGDGVEDAVYLAGDAGAEGGCRLLLVADAGDTVYVVPTASEEAESSLMMPRVNSLVQIDGLGGLEILVDLEAGASTQFLGMFTVSEGSLQRVRVEGAASGHDLFAYGGSVGHIDGSDCGSKPGTVVTAFAGPIGRRYELQITTYEMVGASLRLLPDQPPSRVIDQSQLGEVGPFSSSPFGSCGT